MGADAGSAMDSTDPPDGTEQMETDSHFYPEDPSA